MTTVAGSRRGTRGMSIRPAPSWPRVADRLLRLAEVVAAELDQAVPCVALAERAGPPVAAPAGAPAVLPGPAPATEGTPGGAFSPHWSQ
jgi:hypothetical protein